MKVAAFNVNGVKGQLPRLLEWLDETDAQARYLEAHPTLVGRLKATAVDSEYRGRDKPGDHAPVWIVLEPEPAAGEVASSA